LLIVQLRTERAQVRERAPLIENFARLFFGKVALRHHRSAAAVFSLDSLSAFSSPVAKQPARFDLPDGLDPNEGRVRKAGD
jgi:hypothetical protein